jgi:hypothetical protein
MNNNRSDALVHPNRNSPWQDAADRLNRECQCVNVDPSLLQQQLDIALGANNVPHNLIEQRPHLFARLGVFVTQRQVDQMGRIIAAVEHVVAMPAYREAVLEYAPDIARHEPGSSGVFFGYDFHLGTDMPQLVEINTNAGGALLNAVLTKAQLACCDEVQGMMNGPVPIARLEDELVSMFVEEWEKSSPRRSRESLKTVAIVDTSPEAQYLYPEFLLFQHLFARHGIQALILDPQQLEQRNGALWHQEHKIDLVYNRLTDFDLSEPPHRVLQTLYLTNAAAITPHPRAHAFYADKRNLALLTDAALLRSWGVPTDMVDTLTLSIPRTSLVNAGNADMLWSQRRQLFFKPASGYGSRAVYRGDKLTRRVWNDILAGDYVAQMLALPSERRLMLEQDPIDLKLDIRSYAYGGKMQLLAARMYRGQTTNFRTAGGGFAPIYIVPSDS